jgi:hypothetical protein
MEIVLPSVFEQGRGGIEHSNKAFAVNSPQNQSLGISSYGLRIACIRWDFELTEFDAQLQSSLKGWAET